MLLGGLSKYDGGPNREWVGVGGHVWVGGPLKIGVVPIRGCVVGGKVVSQMWCHRTIC